MNKKYAKQIILAVFVLLFSACNMPILPTSTPTPTPYPSISNAWMGGSVFYDARGHKRAFIIKFNVSDDEQLVDELQIACTSGWPQDSWEGTSANETSAVISADAFSVTVQIPLPTNDPYRYDFPNVKFTGQFISTTRLEGTFSSDSVLGSGKWEASPSAIWDWEQAETR